MDELDRLYRRLVQNIRAGAPELLTRPFELSRIYQELVPYRTNRRELGFDSNEQYELALMQLLAGLRGYLAGEADMQQAMRAELASPNPDLTAFRVYATSTVSLTAEPLRALEQQPASAQSAPRSGGAERASSPGMAGAAAMAARDTESFDDGPIGAPRERRPEAPPRANVPPAATEPVASAAALPPSAPQAPQPPHAPAPPRGAEVSPRGGEVSPRGAEVRRHGGGRGEACRYCGGTLPDGRKTTFCPHCGHNLTVQHCPACGTELEVGWKYCITCGREVGDPPG